MPLKPLIMIASLAALLAAAATPSLAQSVSPAGSQARAARHAPAQIEINPRRLLYRRCIDWYELQHRPSGTVLFPQTRCWWVRG